MKHLNLPENYKFYKKIDFENDKKVATKLSYITLGVAAVMILLPMMFRKVCAGGLSIWLNLAIAIGGCFIYSALHELIHALFIVGLTHQKLQFQWSFPYFCVGTDAGYFGKRSYAIYALAPVLIFGALLALLNFTLPPSYFWCVYIIQVFNISGVTSDVYAITKLAKAPSQTIAQDTGKEIYLFKKC